MKLLVPVFAFYCLVNISGIAGAEKPEPAKDPALQSDLLHRSKQDQEARFGMIKWMKDNGPNGIDLNPNLQPDQLAEFDKLTLKLKEIDGDNLKWLKVLVGKQGWPTRTLVGKDGADAAWILIQHADKDSKFQRECLDLMTALPKEETTPSNIALLTDRVLLAEGKKQLYGTQFKLVDRKLRPLPIEDEAHVDTRRAEFGLPPLAEYTKAVEDLYGTKK
jgi:hypothetical protein